MITRERSLDGVERCLVIEDDDSGLRAVLVIDSQVLGPAAGGVRTAAYESLDAAIEDASRLARAMTIKCALGGLDAGGAKLVVLQHDGLQRARAFDVLGDVVQSLGGAFRTAGDLGTTASDLERMAARCEYVHTDEVGLAVAVARGLLGCVRACAAERGVRLESMTAAVQGAGAIGGTVAAALARAGIAVCIADTDPCRAVDVARDVGGVTVEADSLMAAEVDVLAPCAVSGVVNSRIVNDMCAWALCGAANNVLSGGHIAELLLEAGVLHVPDVIASAGAVIDGVARSVMGVADTAPFIDALGELAGELFQESRGTGHTTEKLARERARLRIDSL